MNKERDPVNWRLKIKMLLSLAIIMAVFLIGGAFIVMAEPGDSILVTKSADCGLVVDKKEREDTGNLNPGDTKYSHILTAV